VQANGNGFPATTAACVDAETLAAWADGGLPKAQAAAVETHLADCERCTAMVATFARTIPDAPLAESLWTRWHLRWLVPLATAATVGALWVLVPRPESPQMTTVGRAPTTESQAAAADAVQPAATTETGERAAPTTSAPSKPADAFAKREESPQSPRQLADQRRADADHASERLQAAPLNETIAVAPPPAREADRAEAKSADPQTDRFSPSIPSANAAPPPTAQAPAPSPATSPAAEASAARAPAAAAPPATLGAASAKRASGVTLAGDSAIVEIASPDPRTRWRVVGAGRVERSTNGGARWEPATLPESATVIAGSSPSPTICWLIGRTGSIYVTTDGLRFVRVSFPDRTDFVSIQAIDGRRATVITIDGRTMRTDDQGASWIRIMP
jgi:hypothetical protein